MRLLPLATTIVALITFVHAQNPSCIFNIPKAVCMTNSAFHFPELNWRLWDMISRSNVKLLVKPAVRKIRMRSSVERALAVSLTVVRRALIDSEKTYDYRWQNDFEIKSYQCDTVHWSTRC